MKSSPESGSGFGVGYFSLYGSPIWDHARSRVEGLDLGSELGSSHSRVSGLGSLEVRVEVRIPAAMLSRLGWLACMVYKQLINNRLTN